MLRRSDPALEVTAGVALAEEEFDGVGWRGLHMLSGASFVLRDVRRFAVMRDFADTCGWMAETGRYLAGEISVRAANSGQVLGVGSFGGDLGPVHLPWPKAPCGSVDLTVSIRDLPRGLLSRRRGRNRAFFGCHRVLSRQWLIDAAVGKGLEIGPGAQPHILPAPNVDVSYLEPLRQEDWAHLNNATGRYAMREGQWLNYMQGEASQLPVPDESLDFIYASHVFEHLSNPIGHLQRWQKKLRPGGKILCVIPDRAATRDAIQEACTMSEWLMEHETDEWSPGIRHYARNLRDDPPGKRTTSAISMGASVHAHFYDNRNCRQLLEFAVHNLGFADFVIEHTPNHKDFHFMLQNRGKDGGR